MVSSGYWTRIWYLRDGDLATGNDYGANGRENEQPGNYPRLCVLPATPSAAQHYAQVVRAVEPWHNQRDLYRSVTIVTPGYVYSIGANRQQLWIPAIRLSPNLSHDFVINNQVIDESQEFIANNVVRWFGNV